MRDVNSLFHQHEELMIMCVLTARKRSGREVNELMGVAHDAFMDSVKSYHAPKGSFATHFRRILNHRLMDYCKDVQQITAQGDTDILLNVVPSNSPCPSKVAAFRDSLEHLSHDALRIATTLLYEAVEQLGLTGTEPPRRIRGEIRRHFLKMGWTHRRVYYAMKELKTTYG